MDNSNNSEIIERDYPIRLPRPDELDDDEDSEDKDKKAFGCEIKDFRDNRDNSVQMGAYGGNINNDIMKTKRRKAGYGVEVEEDPITIGSVILPKDKMSKYIKMLRWFK